MAPTEVGSTRRPVRDLSSPLSGLSARVVDVLFRAGPEGVSRDDLVRLSGSPHADNLSGLISHLRHSRGVAINVRGHRPGWVARPGRYYLAPWGADPS